jgi:phosphoenolpyruvate phosphomutase
MTVYACMCADIIHSGHMALISKAASYGKLIIGLLTDEGIVAYKNPPIMTYQERKIVLENIKGVWKVVQQDSLNYEPNLKKYKPNLVIHGDDWNTGTQKDLNVKHKVQMILNEWEGKVITVPYTQNISSSIIRKRIVDAHFETKNS